MRDPTTERLRELLATIPATDRISDWGLDAELLEETRKVVPSLLDRLEQFEAKVAALVSERLSMQQYLTTEANHNQSVMDSLREGASHAWYCNSQLADHKCNCPRAMRIELLELRKANIHKKKDI